MLFYLLYKLGQIVVLLPPLKIAYWLAERVSDLQCALSAKDRCLVRKNLTVILGEGTGTIDYSTRQVFRNFGKYLVDFLRFSRIDKSYVEKFVKIKGLERLKEAFEKRKGVIALTAHLGNWELAGVVMSVLDYPINAVALRHKNKLVNNLFIRQRTMKGVKVIPMGTPIRKTFEALKKNELVALLGDRDFSTKGIRLEFFNRTAQVPRGPAAISLKSGAPIVPGFMVRDKNNHFLLTFEAPIWPEPSGDTDKDIVTLTGKYLKVIEDYISRYPEQWSMFIDFWG